jgi:hypothetical protein
MNGPITRSRARQLNLQVRSTLVNCVSELTLGAMDVLMIRYLGEDQQGLGKGQGVEEEQQGRPQQVGDHVTPRIFAVEFFLFFTRQNSGVTFSFSFSPR